MKTWLKVVLALASLALLAAGLMRTLDRREQREQALQAQTEAQKTQVVLQIAAHDLLHADHVTLQQTLSISAVVTPSRSAIVKARLPGELAEMKWREGELVKAGDVLARTDDTQARASAQMAGEQLNVAHAQLAIAQRTSDNNQSLARQGFISETALQNANASLDAAKASLASAQAAFNLSQSNLRDTVVKAPISGRVAQKFAQSGELLGVGSPIVEIVDASQLELESNVQTADATQLRMGQVAILSDPASPQVTIKAEVIRVNPKADASNRAVKFYLSMRGKQDLYPGQFLQGHLLLSQISGLGVPLTAIRTDAPRAIVQLVREQRVAHQEVLITSRGELGGVTYALVDGLKAGDQVLSGSVGLIRIGTPVSVQAHSSN